MQCVQGQPDSLWFHGLLRHQDYMYHVNLQGRIDVAEAVDSYTRVDVISRGINPFSQTDAYLALADQPEMRFVISNTTEAGIVF